MTYDDGGRCAQRTERIAGTQTVTGYTYDLDGQLLGVTLDGSDSEAHSYDVNANRTTDAAIYDAQDRLSARDGVAYTFDDDGFLTARGGDAFTDSTAGELLAATVAGQTITYAYDGIGRRVARTDSAGTTGYLYGNPAHPFQVTAVRQPGGALDILHRDDDGHLVAFDRDGARYHVATDQVGTSRVVFTEDGAIVKTVDYDAFGAVTADTDSAFALPLGFAGGLPDPVTGLVRFGFRDYEPASGRWTARDPLLFGGGQGNLYAYVHNDPVRFTDPLGLFCIGFSAYGGVGGGAQLCWDREKGKSVCFEVGVGVGGGAQVSPSGMPAARDDEAIVGGLSASCGGVGLRAGFRLDNCGNLTTDPGSFTADEVGMGKGLAQAAQKGSLGCGVGAKLAGEVCRTW